MAALFPLLAAHADATPPAKPVIRWIVMDFPPLHIVEGPFKGQGFYDEAQRLFEAALPEYEHQHVVTNIARMYKLLEEPDTCAAALLRTSRIAQLRSVADSDLIAVLPNEVQMLASRRADFGKDGSVSLEQLLSQRSLKVLLPPERSYGAAVDAVLERHKGSEQILFMTASSVNAHAFRMLALGRAADYTLGFPVEPGYMAQRYGPGMVFASIPIREQMALQAIAPSCARNAFGKTIIERLEPLLRQRETRERVRLAYERWLDPKVVPRYRQLYDAYFQQGEAARKPRP